MITGAVGGSYKPLTDDNIRAIHEMTLRIMEGTGIKVPNEQALKIFDEHGARVDYETQIVKIPPSMVEEAIDKTPARVVLCGRQEEHDLVLEGARTYLGTGGTVLNCLDLETGERRPTTLEDVGKFALMTDVLDNVSFFVINVYPNELPVEEVDVNRFFHSLANTSKHVMGGIYTMDGLRRVVKMAEELAGGARQLRERPFISFITCVMSPLLLNDSYTDFLIEAARLGIPLTTPAEPLAGATSPCTLAGTIATNNIETLTGVILAQLVNPGTPVIYGSVATNMDMKSGSYLAGSIESGLINAGLAQMAQFYRIPFYATAGMSDSKLPDCQAGYEKAATMMVAVLAGANFIHDAAGILEFCTTASYEQMVIDNEIIGICLRAARGIEVDEDTLAEEVIRRVGPGGNYIAEDHTIRHFQKEFFYPLVADRQPRSSWEKEGSLDTRARARLMARELLETHRPLPLPQRALEKVLQDFKDIRRS
ncbi:MAG: trimethylamine methyltransferase family protein [Dethiobacteria bacterium]|jgi:trimethylamine--corrinoid protein Co-methyltransferase